MSGLTTPNFIIFVPKDSVPGPTQNIMAQVLANNIQAVAAIQAHLSLSAISIRVITLSFLN